MKIQEWQLLQRLDMPLELKVIRSKQRIKEWLSYWHHQCYVSFSGGKDSTVLLDLVRQVDKSIPAVFVDTGLEYPEIREFVKTVDNVIWLKPKMIFSEVLKKYGFPVVSKEVAQKIEEIRNTKSEKLKSKRLYGDANGNGKLSKKWQYLINSNIKISGKCCNVMKKQPFREYEKREDRVPFVGIMAVDSHLRRTSYLNNGCNAFDTKRPMSTPIAFWQEEDIWNYIRSNKIEYSSIYDKGITRTGCMFCMFGVHLEKEPNRFQVMKHIHPKQYEYCMNTLGCQKVLKLLNVPFGEAKDER